jgi:hypothetical protein
MSSQPYIPDALPLNNLAHRLLLPLCGKADAALARSDCLLTTSRQDTPQMLEESETATREFVERELHFRLHKTIRGVSELHNFLSVYESCAAVSA